MAWERESVFRATFLRLLEPKTARAFRAFGEAQLTLALEYQWASPDASPSGAAELEAAAADLRFLGAFLQNHMSWVAGEGDLSKRWSQYGLSLASKLERLAVEITAEIEAGLRESP